MPGRVLDLTVYEVSGSPHDQLGVVWNAPDENDCPVDEYVVVYTLTRHRACPSTHLLEPVVRAKRVGGEVTTVSLNRLRPYSTYNVAVVATNSAGNSTVASVVKDRPGAGRPSRTNRGVKLYENFASMGCWLNSSMV